MPTSYVVDTTLQFAHKLMSNQILFFTSFPRLSQKYSLNHDAEGGYMLYDLKADGDAP